MGKGVGQIAKRCRALKIPCIALAGTIAPMVTERKVFAQARSLRELTTVARAKAHPAIWLERLAGQVNLK
jgi:glycerate kinase